jgi:hypothetical protein
MSRKNSYHRDSYRQGNHYSPPYATRHEGDGYPAWRPREEQNSRPVSNSYYEKPTYNTPRGQVHLDIKLQILPDVIIKEVPKSLLHPYTPEEQIKGFHFVYVTKFYITFAHIIYKTLKTDDSSNPDFLDIYKQRFAIGNFAEYQEIRRTNRECHPVFGLILLDIIKKKASWLLERESESKERANDEVIMMIDDCDYSTAISAVEMLSNTKSEHIKSTLTATLNNTHQYDIIRSLFMRPDPALLNDMSREWSFSKVVKGSQEDAHGRMIISSMESALVTLLSTKNYKIYKTNKKPFQECYSSNNQLVKYSQKWKIDLKARFDHSCPAPRFIRKDIPGHDGINNKQVMEIYEDFVRKSMNILDARWKSFINYILDKDRETSRFPGLFAYIFAHSLAMILQDKFGDPIEIDYAKNTVYDSTRFGMLNNNRKITVCIR